VGKKTAMAVLCVAMAVALAGCGGPGNLIQWDDSVEKATLIAAANSWVSGIEDYDIDAMAGPGIVTDGFLLTIKDSLSGEDTKNLSRLLSELREDVEDQRLFREHRGLSVRLDIDGGPYEDDLLNCEDTVNAWSIRDFGKYQATVEGYFEVFESATGVPRIRTDSGTITASFVRTYNAWKLIAMTIEFGTGYPDDIGYGPVGTVSVSIRRGFGFK
jgi:hypothetical protein